MNRRLAALALCLAFPLPAAGQSGEVRLDLGAARSLPPSGTDAVEASYGLVGLSGDMMWDGGSGFGFALVGGTRLGTFGSDWITAQAAAELWAGGPGVVDVGFGARAYAFRVGRPFVYETTTGEISPKVRLSFGRAAVVLKGEGGYGNSYIALHRSDGRVRRASPNLWHYGGGGELQVVAMQGLVAAGGSVYEGAAGRYERGYVEYLLPGLIGLRLSGEVWNTPHGVRYAGGLGFQLSLGGPWSLRVQGGRGEPDPLVRAPQGYQGGGLLGLRLFDLTRIPEAVVAVGRSSDSTVPVRFYLPESVGSTAQVIGDFTTWEGRTMSLEGDRWVLELHVAPGTYHFGFLVDGEWYLPEDAPGRVADDWGQENGTLVVPGVSGVSMDSQGAEGGDAAPVVSPGGVM